MIQADFKTNFICIRNGDISEDCKNTVRGGRTNNPLSDEGIAQVEVLAMHLKDEQFSTIYSSSLQQAKETAEKVQSYLKVNFSKDIQVIEEPKLREKEWGTAEGKPEADKKQVCKEIDTKIKEECGKSGEIKNRLWEVRYFEGSESDSDVAARMRGTLVSLANAHPNETLVIVSHSNALRTFIKSVNDSGKAVTHREIIRLEYTASDACFKIERERLPKSLSLK